MAQIKYLNGMGLKVMELCAKRKYFLIGRVPINDLFIDDMCVSRFHATIFRYNNDFLLIDHSANGTYYNPKREEFGSETLVGSVMGSVAFQSFKSQVDSEANSMNESVRELKRSEEEGDVPKIPDFVPHKFKKLEDIEYIIKMIEDEEQIGMLRSCARRLEGEGYIGIPISNGIKTLKVMI